MPIKKSDAKNHIDKKNVQKGELQQNKHARTHTPHTHTHKVCESLPLALRAALQWPGRIGGRGGGGRLWAGGGWGRTGGRAGGRRGGRDSRSGGVGWDQAERAAGDSIREGFRPEFETSTFPHLTLLGTGGLLPLSQPRCTTPSPKNTKVKMTIK